MRIFLGSSTERSKDLARVAGWVEEAGHEAWPWNLPGLFPLGQFTFETLNQLKDRVDASIFIFGEDDKVWYRGDSKMVPRDNVLIEYGLFAGVLEPSRVAICKVGDVRMASDLAGVTYLNLSDSRRAKSELLQWLRKISGISALPGRARVVAFQNKFSMSATNKYWRDLFEDARTRFVLLGGSNKSWIHRSVERRKALGKAIIRIIHNDGEVAFVCSDRQSIVDKHAEFIRECVVVPTRKSRQRALLSRIASKLRIGTADDLRYQAVICDDRIVVIPLLHSPEFKEESLVFELNPTKHGDHYASYENDILRTIERCEIHDFVKTRCVH